MTKRAKPFLDPCKIERVTKNKKSGTE